MSSRRITPAVVLLAIAVTACGGVESGGSDGGDVTTESAAAFPRDVTDAAGVSHTFEEAPQIGSLWYGATMTLADLGIAPHAALTQRAETTSPFLFPVGPPAELLAYDDWDDVEAWARTGSEVILAGGPPDPGYDAISAAAPVFLLNSPPWFNGTSEGIEGLQDNVRMLGELTGSEDAADDALARYDNVVAALSEAAPDDAADRVVAIMEPNDGGAYWVSGQDTAACQAMVEAEIGQCPDGIVNGEISAEALLAQDPDWIVYCTFGYDDATWEDRDDPVWEKLSAVQNGQIYDADAYSYSDSLRQVEFMLQEYGYETFGSESGIPDPGSIDEANPTESPLAAGQ